MGKQMSKHVGKLGKEADLVKRHVGKLVRRLAAWEAAAASYWPRLSQ